VIGFVGLGRRGATILNQLPGRYFISSPRQIAAIGGSQIGWDVIPCVNADLPV
jgi:hypothetical protein